MNADNMGALGGAFALLVFCHFVADWVFQSHATAVSKTTDAWVLNKHCLTYAIIMAVLIEWLFHRQVNAYVLPDALIGGVLCVLYFSHVVIDTYVPVMLWAKHLRRAPQFDRVVRPVTLTKQQVDGLIRGDGQVVGVGWSDREVDGGVTYPSDREAFKAFFMTPVGAILCITMDQLFHIAFLLPIAYLLVKP